MAYAVGGASSDSLSFGAGLTVTGGPTVVEDLSATGTVTLSSATVTGPTAVGDLGATGTVTLSSATVLDIPQVVVMIPWARASVSSGVDRIMPVESENSVNWSFESVMPTRGLITGLVVRFNGDSVSWTTGTVQLRLYDVTAALRLDTGALARPTVVPAAIAGPIDGNAFNLVLETYGYSMAVVRGDRIRCRLTTSAGNLLNAETSITAILTPR